MGVGLDFVFKFGVGTPATDPYFANVSMLLPFNGTNGSTTFTDASSNGFTVTANGNAQISTAQSKWGGASGLFDGSGDYLSVASNAAFYLGTGDFTLEAWIRFNSVPGVNNSIPIVSAEGSGGMFFGYIRELYYTQGWGIGLTAVSWGPLTGATASAGTWYHVAVSRSETTMRFFVNGTQVGSTFTNSQSYDLSTTNLNIGGQSSSNYLNGNIDDLRITKGIARYTANFAPPSAPFPTS